jgi:magnesium transporter
MLQAYPDAGDCRLSAAGLAEGGLGGHVWFDLQDPTPDELAEVKRQTGLDLPARAALEEIEQSSRLREQGDALYLSAPLVGRGEDGAAVASPTGFVLTPRLCVTVRFAPSQVFDAVKGGLAGAPQGVSAPDVFARLLEEVVDRAADHLETSAAVLDDASRIVFHAPAGGDAKRRRLTRQTDALRETMTAIGRASERMSKARYTLVCIARMAQFAADRGKAWLGADVVARLAGVRADIASLEQYEENLLSRVQLLQDAATAFISIEQNDVVKVLTIASVAGVPPVLVVGVYGMNFHDMPELGWRYGYPYALALIVLTTLIPLAWFKWKKWM